MSVLIKSFILMILVNVASSLALMVILVQPLQDCKTVNFGVLNFGGYS